VLYSSRSFTSLIYCTAALFSILKHLRILLAKIKQSINSCCKNGRDLCNQAIKLSNTKIFSWVLKMRPSFLLSSTLLLTFFTSTSTALEALESSPCAVQCGNVLGSTSGDDIVCPDSSYTAANLVGSTFSSCITCQLGSNYVDPVSNQTDLQLALCEFSNSCFTAFHTFTQQPPR
jgi:hypothetical protein